MSNPLHQLNIQFRLKGVPTVKEEEKLKANLATVLVGAAAEAGLTVILTDGLLGVTKHVHDARETGACPMCITLAQDGNA